MLRPPISCRTLAVFDFMRVPPPAASTITVRSLDMGTNLIPERGLLAPAKPVEYPQGAASALAREPGSNLEPLSPVGLPGLRCCPARRALTFYAFPGWSAGPEVLPRPAGLNLLRIPRLVCRQGP